MFLVFILLLIFFVDDSSAYEPEIKNDDPLQQKRAQADALIIKNTSNVLKQEEGIKLYHELIDQGDAYAAQELACHYEEGVILSPKKDEERTRLAIDILKKGADKNQPNAIFSLARLNKKYDYTLLPVHKMIQYLIIGDQLEHENCRCLLGTFYRDKSFCIRWNIPYDPQQAISVFSRTTVAKSSTGAALLGDMYLSGELGSKDFVEAYKILKPFIGSDSRIRMMWTNIKKEMPYPLFLCLVEQQFEVDDDQANYFIAKGYINGRYGLPKNLELAEHYLKQGIAKKNPVKCLYLLAKLYKDRKTFLYKPREVEQLIEKLRSYRTRLANYYRFKLTISCSIKFSLENLRFSHDPRDFCANYHCGRQWGPRVYKKSPDTAASIAKNYFGVAIKNDYLPAYCYVAESYLFGYLGTIDAISAKRILEVATTKPDSYKAKVMLSNFQNLLDSYTYQTYLKDPKNNSALFPKLCNILFNYK